MATIFRWDEIELGAKNLSERWSEVRSAELYDLLEQKENRFLPLKSFGRYANQKNWHGAVMVFVNQQDKLAGEFHNWFLSLLR